MSTSPKKLHDKLQHSKHASVSADSLLGVLASAYGTKELDSKCVFDTNTVNWRHISVENFKLQLTKEQSVEAAELKSNKNNRDVGKNSVCTSTTNLKLLRNSDSKNDITLVSIKSLEEINKCNVSTVEYDMSDDHAKKECGPSKNKSLENTKSMSSTEIDKSKCQMVDIDRNCNNHGDIDEQHTTICGFFVDGPDQQIVFDIKFFKKIRNTHFPIFDTNEQDISINVTDMVKQTKTSIELSKRCISKCSYFTEVDNEYGLENLEVCVKCNSSHFDWIVEWVKADVSMCKPSLCVNNVKGILLIAYHLKIYILIEECLDFFHQNLKSVLEINGDITHIFNENLSIQFAKRICNTDVNSIPDEFECFTMKIFCALIRLLADNDECVTAGHHSSLATMFQCVNCEKLLSYSMMSMVPCSTGLTQLDYKGDLQYFHECLPSWNLSKYIELIFEEFQNWQLVYWYLWGMCHFLYCTECRAPYPLSQSEWCPYHPNSVEYFPMNSDLYHPIGSYTCCGEKAFKFNVLRQCSGCKFKNHTPDLSTSKEKEIYKIYEMNKQFISCKTPEVGPKKFLKLVRKTENNVLCDKAIERFWWDGIQLAPKEKKDYSIIPLHIFNRLKDKPHQKKIAPKDKPLTFSPQVHFGMMPSCPEIVSDNSLEMLCSVQCKKNKSKLPTVPSSKCKMRNKLSYITQENESVWSSSLTNRDNQENQRDFEELAMKRLVKMLTPTTVGSIPEPVVGTYVRLEAEWWQEHCADSKTSGIAKSSGTVVNRTFPLSWFRRPPM